MSLNRQNLMRWGESLAVDYLGKRDYRTIARNTRTLHSEIDLVACQDQETIFVEFKTRTSYAFGLPEEAITSQEREHLINAGQDYLLSHPELDGVWSVDVIAIMHISGQEPEIEHF